LRRDHDPKDVEVQGADVEVKHPQVAACCATAALLAAAGALAAATVTGAAISPTSTLPAPAMDPLTTPTATIALLRTSNRLMLRCL